MRWFKHDSDACADAKLKKVKMKYGMSGYGLYWHCLELICSDIDVTHVTFELEHDAEIIAFDTGISVELVNEMMAYMVDLGLFEQSQGKITCLKMAKRLSQSMTSNSGMRLLIDNMRHNHDSVMTQSQKIMQEEKRREENKPSSDSDESDLFDSFWKNYPRKESKKKSHQAFKNLTKTKQQLAISDSANRYADTERRFVPLPTTYLHGERWEDESTVSSQPYEGNEI